MTKKSIIILNIFYLINFTIYLFYYLTNNNFGYTKQSNYISYSFGFVRRGIFGELIKFISFLNINTFIFIKIFSIIALTLVIYFFYKKLKQYNYSYNFLFLPFTITYTFLCGFIEFKDYFLILLFILITEVLKKNIGNFFKYILINSIAILGILIHEIFFFISIPFLSLYTFQTILKQNKISTSILYSLLIYLPSYIAIISVIYYHGTSEIAQKLYLESFNYIPKGYESTEMTGGIGSIGHNSSIRFLELYKKYIWNGFSRGIIYTLFIIQLMYITLNFNFFKKDSNYSLKNKNLFFYFTFQLIALSPIFIVATDWSRFISFAFLTSMIIHFQIPTSNNIHLNNLIKIYYEKSINIFSIFIKKNKSTFYIINYFCIIPYLAFGNTNWQFTNTIFMIVNYLTKIIDVI